MYKTKQQREEEQLLANYSAPPRLVEVEKSIIATMVYFPEALVEALSRIDPGRDIYNPAHRETFSLISRMHEKYGAVSLSPLMDKMDELGLPSDWINSFSASPNHMDLYIRELIEYRTKREQYMSAMRMLSSSTMESVGSEDIQSELLNDMNKWAVTGEIRARTISEIEEDSKLSNIGKKLSLHDQILDKYMYKNVGSHIGTTETLEAPSKHGKSWYGAFRAADYARQGIKGLYITLEDITENVANRIKASLGPDVDKYKDNVIINDDAFELSEILRLIWQYKLKFDIQYVVIDYLQLIDVSEVRMDEKTQIKMASKEITKSAKMNEVFIINCAQPKNISNERTGWKAAPTADDLYGSGQIKKDSFCVTTLFRPGMLDELIYENEGSKRRMVESHNGLLVNANSVFIRVDIQRIGQPSRQWFQLIHTADQGLVVQQEPGMEPASNPSWKPIMRKTG